MFTWDHYQLGTSRDNVCVLIGNQKNDCCGRACDTDYKTNTILHQPMQLYTIVNESETNRSKHVIFPIKMRSPPALMSFTYGKVLIVALGRTFQSAFCFRFGEKWTLNTLTFELITQNNVLREVIVFLQANFISKCGVRTLYRVVYRWTLCLITARIKFCAIMSARKGDSVNYLINFMLR